MPLDKKGNMDLEDEAWDMIFSSLKQEIMDKNHESSSQNSSNLLSCQICNSKLENTRINHCSNCGLRICKKCKSNRLCLYCFTNLKNSYQKMLKISKILILFFPLIEISILSIFLSLDITLIIAASTAITFSLLYFFILQYIRSFPVKCFHSSWINTIQSEKFKTLVNGQKTTKFIPNNQIEEEKIRREKKITKLKEWINQDRLIAKMPVPSHFQNEESIQQLDYQIQNQNAQSNRHILENIESIKNESKKEAKSKKFIASCPICGSPCKIKNFCLECNLKFCPDCLQSANPFASYCICGFKYPNIESSLKFDTIDEEIEKKN